MVSFTKYKITCVAHIIYLLDSAGLDWVTLLSSNSESPLISLKTMCKSTPLSSDFLCELEVIAMFAF